VGGEIPLESVWHNMYGPKARNVPLSCPTWCGVLGEAMRHVVKLDRLLTRLENAYRWLKPVFGIMTAVGAIAATIATVIISLYLLNLSIYISPVDISIRSLEIFMFVFSALVLTVVGVLLWPLFTRYTVPPETRDSLPNLFGIPARGTFSNFLKEYLLYYFTFIMLNLIVMPVFLYFELPTPKIIWSTTSLFCISALALYIYRLKSRRLKVSRYIDLSIDLVVSNLRTIGGMLLFEVIILRVWEHGVADIIESKEKVTLEMIAAGLFVIFCHAFMAWLRPKLSMRVMAGSAVIALCVLWVYPGPAAFVALALPESQLGGGTRISYRVIGADATTPGPASGCLVLATTSSVVIGELDNNRCPLLSKFGFSASEVKVRPVHVFSRSEVNISEVPGG
jgi:hypothetical protein